MIFDHERTVARLDALPVRLRAGVGVVCLERVLPIADAVTDAALIREALKRIGRWAEGETVTFREVQDVVDAHARRAEAAKVIAEAEDDGEHDDDDEHDGVSDAVDLEPTRGALDRMIETLEDGVRALARTVDPEERITSGGVATAMAAACNVVQRFGHYADANELLAFEELAWQERVLAEAETGRDAARLRPLLETTPEWTEHLEDAF